MEERIIQFAPFLASRANEIASLQNNLKSKYLNSTAQPFQVIHKHMRRRAMSHNRYRIPSQLRKQMHGPGLEERDLKQKIPKCRKHLRKRKDLIFMNRSNKIQWMETHLYQVKRMKMINYCGFKVPEKANEKNFRAVHRYFDHGSMIFDASYYQIIEGNIENELVIDDHTIIHPQELTDTDFVVHNNKFNIFQIIGKESLQIINAFLNIFNCSIDGETHKYFCFNYQFEKIQSVTAQKGRKIKTLADYDEEMKDMKEIYENKGDEDINRSVWQIDQNQFIKRFKIDTRNRYTHQRTKKKIYQALLEIRQKEQQQKKQEQQKQDQQNQVDPMKKKKAMRWLLNQMDKNENDISVELYDQNENEKIVEKEIQIEQSEILLSQNDQNLNRIQQNSNIKPKDIELKLLIIPPSKQLKKQIDIGYKLVINLGGGLIIWRLFNQLKLKPIGLRDIRQICLENNLLFNEYENEDLIDNYLKSTNKLNYLALQFPYPFSFDFSLYPSWCNCILVAYKNVPKKQALILQPSEEDFELLRNKQYKIKIERTEDEKPKLRNRVEVIQFEKRLSEIKQKRKILGQIFFGNISLQHGKGVGQGKIDGSFIGKEIIVLFRNHDSEYCFFADCKVNTI
ncbi:unnamed protein product [Paramecium sonneborni]|uniref:Pop1 N-terminal domain-containing protein n=1 Tax=Paramecium sonneborni TaxID=65129 RepID=A0A8S1KAI3_9CILI|nr:unnamed protein product [Paramecium sonneborni]